MNPVLDLPIIVSERDYLITISPEGKAVITATVTSFPEFALLRSGAIIALPTEITSRSS